MDTSGQIHAPAALPPDEEHSVLVRTKTKLTQQI